jgi:isoleucyl-tRNA synthetase
MKDSDPKTMASAPKPEASKSAIALREEATLKFWQDNKIFEKSVEMPAGLSEPKGDFVFYDGPPYATGLPHHGHMLPGSVKDAIGRYRTMQGFRVRRRWGWDCHGLPIENLIEKELGFTTKKDIETYGVAAFNAAAKASVLRYADEWKRIIPRVGRFVDMENDYKTMDPSYTESVLWSFKEIWNKGLVYEGYKSMHLCPRCETTLSNFEVSQGYKDIVDLAVTVKFELADEPGTFVLAWTTTPWTLPGNTALAVHPEVDYVKVRVLDAAKQEKNGELSYVHVILAKDIFESLGLRNDKDPLRLAFGEVYADKEKDGEVARGAEVVEEFKGSALLGKRYKPLFAYYESATLPNKENIWKIWPAEYVTTDAGTGIVHLAPAFGEEDLLLSEKLDIPIIQHVGMDGRMKPEVTDFAGMQVKSKENHQAADIEIIKYLAGKDLLFAKEKITHSYPHCWRCDTPLLNYATSSWFVKVTAIQDNLIAENKKVRWVPEEVGSGRFGKWLEGVRDWPVSRSRYWGAPIPVWRCETCKATEVLGSLDDIKKKTSRGNTFIVMRHGEADINVAGIINSDRSKPHSLTDRGREETLASVRSLRPSNPDIIYSSPLLRTKETAEIAAKELGYDLAGILYDDRLREIGMGGFEGKTWNEYFAALPENFNRFSESIEDSEPLADVKRRVAEFLYEIEETNSGKTILIVTHGAPAWLMLAAAEGVPNQPASVHLHALRTSANFLGNAETREFSFSSIPHNEDYVLDFHRPYIDEVSFPCACGGTMRRIPEIFDVWYDSGSMPYGQMHYPFERADAFDPAKGIGYPADFIAEGLDQTRGWFYVMLVLGTALFEKSPYKAVIVPGLILAEDGQKMSKRLKNYPELDYVLDRYGADALRYYLLSSPAAHGEEAPLSERNLDETVKKLMLRLENVHSFYATYGDTAALPDSGSQHVLDRWILARLAELGEAVTLGMESFELDRATRPILGFIDDLSTWYLRRSRDRFKSEDISDRSAASATLRYALLSLSKLMAPFVPFIAEDLYQKVKEDADPESVHLAAWPEVGQKDTAVLAEMDAARSIVEAALALRAKAGIKVRQPLAELRYEILQPTVSGEYNSATVPASEYYTDSRNVLLSSEIESIIADELNVKLVRAASSIDAPASNGVKVSLDTTITPELKEEGNLRDLIREVQELRKAAKLDPAARVPLRAGGNEQALAFLEQHSAALGAAALVDVQVDPAVSGEMVTVDGMEFTMAVR